MRLPPPHDAGEDVGEPSLRLDVVEPGGPDQRVHHGGALAAAIGFLIHLRTTSKNASAGGVNSRSRRRRSPTRRANPGAASGRAMLLLQWCVVAAAALTFLVGCAERWPRLPAAMVAWYVVMAAVCAWQTFFILEHPSRFAQMALEYAEYVAIAIYLHLSPHIRGRLSRSPAALSLGS
jgi:hypothetical protein